MRTKLMIAVVMLVASLVTTGHALTPHGRRHTGTIQSVDHANRRAVLLSVDDTKPITFIWNKHTDFIAGTSFVKASSMLNGSRVEITLHRPFFGEPFITKVVLFDSPSKPKPNQTKPRKNLITI